MPLHFLTDVYFNNPAMIIADIIIINTIVPVSSLDHIYSTGRFVFDQSLFDRICSICSICFSKNPVPCALMGSDICLCLCSSLFSAFLYHRGQPLWCCSVQCGLSAERCLSVVLYKLLGARVPHCSFSRHKMSRKLYVTWENQTLIRYLALNASCRKTNVLIHFVSLWETKIRCLDIPCRALIFHVSFFIFHVNVSLV